MTAPRFGRVPSRSSRDPVPHHAGLAERERDEDADDVELDQRGEVGLEDDQDDDRRRAPSSDHAVRVDQAVAAGVQRLGRVAVAARAPSRAAGSR